MSDATTIRMINAYMERATAPMFLSGFFQSPAVNFHNSEKVEIDVERDDEDVAIVVTEIGAGGRKNESSLYTNKAFTPPIYKEEATIDGFKLIERQPGQDPFQNPDYQANAVVRSFDVFRKLERKIRRSVELQASQVLQTGTLTLTDDASNSLYTLDFGMKATHEVTVGTAWSGAGTPIDDIDDIARVIRRDGKSRPDRLIMGNTAMRNFLADSEVQARLDNRSMQVGMVAPEVRGEGATFQGWVWIGNYRFEMWLYDGFYRDPVSGNHVPFVADDKVIVMSSGGRLDLTYGNIPIIDRDPRASQFLPPRMSSPDRGIDLVTNAWMSRDGTSLTVFAGARPLTIPTAIDTFGCLDTEP